MQGRDPITTEDFKYEKLETVAFWDAYLKDDPAAKAYLKSDEIGKLSHSRAWI